MAFAAALSEHPVTAHATGEVVGHVLEGLAGETPDLAFLFLTASHAGALEDAAGVVRAVLAPTVLVGCSATGVAGTDREVEEQPAVSLWAGRGGAVAPVRLMAEQIGPEEVALTGWPPDGDVPLDDARALVLIGDPFSFPADSFLTHIDNASPGLRVVGGLASGGRGPGGNRLLLDASVVTDGAVGVLLGDGWKVDTVVSQGCRPIGDPLIVTRSERNVMYELAGRPALDRLTTLLESGISERERELARRGLHVGLVIDEHKTEFEPGDFLVRNVLGGNREHGAVVLNDTVELGTTVQFQVRDASTADEDLHDLLAARAADAALLFTCNGRGMHLFGEPDHDAAAIAGALGVVPTAGFFAQGEFGPLAGRNFVHGFTASIALFHRR